jgi:hypothetical protein
MSMARVSGEGLTGRLLLRLSLILAVGVWLSLLILPIGSAPDFASIDGDGGRTTAANELGYGGWLALGFLEIGLLSMVCLIQRLRIVWTLIGLLVVFNTVAVASAGFFFVPTTLIALTGAALRKCVDDPNNHCSIKLER